jgi:hypothetical protein
VFFSVRFQLCFAYFGLVGALAQLLQVTEDNGAISGGSLIRACVVGVADDKTVTQHFKDTQPLEMQNLTASSMLASCQIIGIVKPSQHSLQPLAKPSLN